MVNVINCTISEFLERTKTQDVVAFGAGRLFRSQYEVARLNKVKYIIDSDRKKVGTNYEIAGKSILIVGKDKLRELQKKKNAIVITTTLAANSVLQELDMCEELEGIDCYLLSFMINKDEKQEIIYPTGTPRIPKIIHYCWFGKTEIPEHLKRYMESWRKYCPDYEIIRWDENNYDVSKNQYMKEAYENKKWGFVPDYARLDIVHQYGGIYLDTDVEVTRPFNDLLYSSSFFGYIDMRDVNLGQGFGAEKGNQLVAAMKGYYKNQRFIDDDGNINLQTCIEYQKPVLKKWGFRLNGVQEIIDGNIIYPREVFNPLGRLGVNALFTENTHSIHHADLSWESEQNRQEFKDSIKKIMERIK